MKKTYIKPEIMFENFSISTNIASGCEESISLISAGTCGIKWGKSTIFTDDVDGCSTKIVDGDDDYNRLCYHVPDSNYNVFNS